MWAKFTVWALPGKVWKSAGAEHRPIYGDLEASPRKI